MDLASLHGYLIGFAIIGSWAVIGLWALVLRVLTRRRGGGVMETPVFWRAVSVAQVLLGVQLLVGLVLLALGRRPGDATVLGLLFHLSYGILSPLVVLYVAHKWSREGRVNPHAAFAVVGLVIFGLTFRAFQVGLPGG